MRACDYFKYRNSNIGKDYSDWLLNDDPFMQTVFEYLNKFSQAASPNIHVRK